MSCQVAFYIRGSLTSLKKATSVQSACKLSIELVQIWLVNLNVAGSSDWLMGLVKALRLREAHRQEKGKSQYIRGKGFWLTAVFMSLYFWISVPELS